MKLSSIKCKKIKIKDSAEETHTHTHKNPLFFVKVMENIFS